MIPMVHVFKTSVKTKMEVKLLSSFLNQLIIPSKWSFDLNDYDKILRIESQANIIDSVMEGLKIRGFECEELD